MSTQRYTLPKDGTWVQVAGTGDFLVENDTGIEALLHLATTQPAPAADAHVLYAGQSIPRFGTGNVWCRVQGAPATDGSVVVSE